VGRPGVSRPDGLLELERLDQITRRLRVECPWDREQDERSIVPHTIEEAYELADAAHAGDDGKLLDELGDVLFQVLFLSLLLEERGSGSLADVARLNAEKLIRRHPHVFGEAQAREAAGVRDAADVLRNWDAIKRTEPNREEGLFNEIPENLPALLHARKAQRRAASAGVDLQGIAAPLAALREGVDEVAAAGSREQAFEALGDLLFAVVGVAREAHLDPELALRDSTRRFRERVLSETDQRSQ
jgi:MazG family protein